MESVFQGLRIAFPFALPLPGAFPTDAGRQRESRRPWRVVVLTLKGKAEVAAEEPETVDRAFLAHLPLPDGVTMVGAGAIPTPWGAYRTGRMPKGLLSGLVPPTVAALGGGGRDGIRRRAVRWRAMSDGTETPPDEAPRGAVVALTTCGPYGVSVEQRGVPSP